MSFLSLLKPGDVLVLILCGALTVFFFFNAWSSPPGSTLVVRSQGKLMVRANLSHNADYAVDGVIGVSRIEVRNGRARVAADPGPRQICVKQGWVSRSGDAALCLANQVSVEIGGYGKSFDSMNY